jgi:hypothetical protein
MLSTACSPLHAAYWRMLNAEWILPVACCILHVACCMLHAACLALPCTALHCTALNSRAEHRLVSTDRKTNITFCLTQSSQSLIFVFSIQPDECSPEPIYQSIILSFYHSIILLFYHSIILSFYQSFNPSIYQSINFSISQSPNNKAIVTIVQSTDI